MTAPDFDAGALLIALLAGGDDLDASLAVADLAPVETPFGPLSGVHLLLAHRVLLARPDRLQEALQGDAAAAGWAFEAAAVVVPFALASKLRLPHPEAENVEHPGLRLTDRARTLSLPLLALATDLARTVPGGILVDVQDLHGVGGRTVRPVGARVRVTLASAATPSQAAAVWAHEVAHVLDGRFSACTNAEAERWADALAEQLLARLPTSVAEARPLMDEVDRLTGRDRADVVPAPDVDDLVAMAERMALLAAWARLDLTPRR